MVEASYYTELDDKKVLCTLCPARCRLKPGQTGSCKIRKNIDGKLYALTYGLLSALHTDPIEKKPLYHFFPGKPVLSAGSVGCNLHCVFCQNYDISQQGPDHFRLQKLEPQELVSDATSMKNNIGIAYTYNEPLIWFEYVRDTAVLARKAGLKNILVSNGYINPEPLEELIPFIDAVNIDLKAFDDAFYRKYTASRLSPVLESLKILVRHQVHTEITILVIPGLNDDEEKFGQMCSWIEENLGRDTVLHISRYFPAWKMTLPPTPPQTLEKLYHLALHYLNYVYVGNIHLTEGSDTRCPECHTTVIRRSGYYTEVTGLDSHGNCVKCGHHIMDHL